ncbi:MAG: polynucleotide adenylyltransferase PcnB [Myxococcaceae bacterium]|nr:polynucleotide adenylyltransferase PcnB [Myxococcaceae bacterium]
MTSEATAPGQDPARAIRPEDPRPAVPPAEPEGRDDSLKDDAEDALMAYRDDSPEPPPRFGDEGRRAEELAQATVVEDEDDDDEAAEVIAAVTPEARDEERAGAGLQLRMAPAEEAEIDPAKLDPDALKVVYRLRQFGHEAYFVGGCVRDLLLGRTPKDFDVATSATPNEVRNVFRNCRLIGRRFRLAHVYFKGGKIIEVSTFRANPTGLAGQSEDENGADANGEEGDLLITMDNVFGTAEEDARRRDFTINGLFYDPFAGKVIDYVRGRRDLEERNIRTIGNPEIRMREDPVRILRAVRFACKCGLELESRTYAAMEGAVEDLPRCAPARLLEETFRLIRGGIATDSLKLIAALDALKILLPPVHEYLQRTGEQGEARFFAHTRALDRRVREGEQLEDAVLLAAILLPIANDAPATEEQGKPPSVAEAIEQLLSDLVRNARLPRRIAERCRMILIAQRTLSGQRRRRGSLASFRRHPLFNEALTVFAISVEATGEFREQLDAWLSGGAPSVAPDAEGPRRKRRRRRRKSVSRDS